MSQLDSLKFMTPRQVKAGIVRCIMAGLVPYVRSSPGIGKSAIVRAIAKEFNLKLIDLRLAQCTPEDLQGLPRFREIKDAAGKIIRSVAEFVPFNTFPIIGDEPPPGYDGWLIFFDELSSATKMVQAACYKVLLDREVGQLPLSDKVVMVCAGNLDTDRAVVNPMSTALQSRLVTLLMHINQKEFMQDVVYPGAWDHRIAAYLNYKPSQLHDFRPDHNEHTFCCPRTWEFLNKLIKGNDIHDEDVPLFGGTITSGVAADFVQFTKVYDRIPKLSDILADPNGIRLPDDNIGKFAAASMAAEHADPKNLTDLGMYLERFPGEFRIMFFRMLMGTKPQLRSEPAFRKALVELSRHLND